MAVVVMGCLRSAASHFEPVGIAGNERYQLLLDQITLRVALLK